MKIKELKKILERFPDNSEIFIKHFEQYTKLNKTDIHYLKLNNIENEQLKEELKSFIDNDSDIIVSFAVL